MKDYLAIAFCTLFLSAVIVLFAHSISFELARRILS